MNLKLNYIAWMSVANGPGRRCTLWVQGCSIHCLGCQNIDTWDPGMGYELPVKKIIDDILVEKNLDGVTITGGEPLDQLESVYELCYRLFGKISIFLTTGYTLEQIYYKKKTKIMSVLDIICTGPFKSNLVCEGEWKGSKNQYVIPLTQLGEEQLKMPVISKEVIIDNMGSITTTGFHP